MGSAQPPEMSLGVMREGGLPISTVGAFGFAGAGSGVFQALSLPEDQGSNMAELLCVTIGGGFGGATVDFGAGAVTAERLKAEFIVLVGALKEVSIGDETFVGGGGAGTGAGDADAKPEKSSDAKRSSDIAGTAGFDAATGALVKAKLSPFDGARAGTGAGFG